VKTAVRRRTVWEVGTVIALIDAAGEPVGNDVEEVSTIGAVHIQVPDVVSRPYPD